MFPIFGLLFCLCMLNTANAAVTMAPSQSSNNISDNNINAKAANEFDDLFSESQEIRKAKKSNPQCEDIVGQVYEDITHAKEAKSQNSQANFHWKKISWLEALLSDPTTSKVVEETLYIWNNYSIMLRNGQIIGITGQYPGKKAIKTNLSGFDFVQQTIAEIGEPKKVVVAELTQFSWVCKDPRNSLTATIDEKGTVVGISGAYCSSTTDCVPFEADGDQSVLLKQQNNLLKPNL